MGLTFRVATKGVFHTLILEDPVTVKPVEIIRAFEIPAREPAIARVLLQYVALGAQAYHDFCSRVTGGQLRDYQKQLAAFREGFEKPNAAMARRAHCVKLEDVRAATILFKM